MSKNRVKHITHSLFITRLVDCIVFFSFSNIKEYAAGDRDDSLGNCVSETFKFIHFRYRYCICLNKVTTFSNKLLSAMILIFVRLPNNLLKWQLGALLAWRWSHCDWPYFGLICMLWVRMTFIFNRMTPLVT